MTKEQLPIIKMKNRPCKAWDGSSETFEEEIEKVFGTQLEKENFDPFKYVKDLKDQVNELKNEIQTKENEHKKEVEKLKNKAFEINQESVKLESDLEDRLNTAVDLIEKYEKRLLRENSSLSKYKEAWEQLESTTVDSSNETAWLYKRLDYELQKRGSEEVEPQLRDRIQYAFQGTNVYIKKPIQKEEEVDYGGYVAVSGMLNKYRCVFYY